MGGRLVSVPGLASRELLLSSYFLVLLEGFVIPRSTTHRSLLPVAVLFVMFDVGGWTSRFPLFVGCLWVRLGCCVLVPVLSRDLCMAPAQFGWGCSGLSSLRVDTSLASVSAPLGSACIKQPCIQAKRTKLCVMWKLKHVDFFSVREIFGCFPEKIRTVFQQFC